MRREIFIILPTKKSWMNAIEFENVSKQYRLGLVSTRTLRHDLNRFWITKILGKEDPYLKIGERNDRTTKGLSEYVWALKDISFNVGHGEVVGIIGRNGAGKSTLLKILSRVTTPTTGTVRANGRIGSLLQVGTGFHPEMTGRENIFMNGAILGMTKNEISSKLEEIIDFSGCGRYIDTPVKRYSTGMLVRLGFAVASHLETDILVVDEVLAVGDSEFQKKALGRIHDVSKGDGRTVLFVSHNMESVRRLCTRGVVLNEGCIDYDGDVQSAIEHYTETNAVNDKPLRFDDLSDAPGNQYVKIKKLEIRPSKGNKITVESGFDVELVFQNYRKNEALDVMFRFFSNEDLLVLEQPKLLTTEKNSEIGVYKIIMHVPSRLLNVGKYKLKVYFRESGKYVIFGPYDIGFVIDNGNKCGIIGSEIEAVSSFSSNY